MDISFNGIIAGSLLKEALHFLHEFSVYTR